jgi:cyclase
MKQDHQSVLSEEMLERPDGYLGPNLNPDGLHLQPKQLGRGVYALMANQVPKDNNGLIIGDKGAVVVDAGINGAISRQIQHIARRLSAKPIRYLVNTTYHGDHTFGNAAFADDVTIISSRLNKESMRDLDREKRIRTGNLRGNLAALAGVDRWRRPDIVFDEYAEIDLGDLTVELWHFGPGNAPGDTIVYVPRTKTAWTGNYLMVAGIPPMLLEGGPDPYIQSLLRMRETLDVDTIVPGHGPMGSADAALENMIGYLRKLRSTVEESLRAGHTLDETLSAFPTSDRLGPPEGMTPIPALAEMMPHLHRLNVMAAYRALEAQKGD